MVEEIKKDEFNNTGNSMIKKIDGWFIVRQILGFIITMLLAPMLLFGACFTGSIGWAGSSATPMSVSVGILILLVFFVFFRTTRNYGVKAALVILAINTCLLFFG